MCEDTNENEYFVFRWDIENFNFCWHKTGEHLESPAFYMKTSFQTSWRLRLYPRGQHDGEYISCYLFREGGGPVEVKVEFELYIDVVNTLLKPFDSFFEVKSFKNFQSQGGRCFVSRRVIFSPTASQREKFTLTFGCRIFKVDEDILNFTQHFAVTKIMMERISATEVLDHDAGLHSQSSTDMEVKSLLENDPLISISVSCLEESLVIKILPKNCAKIKYAICKITIVKKWANESPIEYVQSWIGKIQTDIMRYHAPYQDKKSFKLGLESKLPKTFIVHYDFEFLAEGKLTSSLLINHCISDIDLQYARTSNALECFDINSMTTNCVRTALDTLKYLYTSGPFVDKNVKAGFESLQFHKAFLCARSPMLKSMYTNEGLDINVSNMQDEKHREFMLFLYTDNIIDLSPEILVQLLNLACIFEVEMLKTKCRLHLVGNMDVETANVLLIHAHQFEDSFLKAVSQKYIITYDDLVFNTWSWKILLKGYKQLAKETLLSKYIKKKDERHRNYKINTSLV